MKLFKCQSCGQVLYFENTRCEQCGHVLGYLPPKDRMAALEPATGDTWATTLQDVGPVRFCANVGHGACNWLLPADGGGAFCLACRHNHTIPDLSVPENLRRWQRLEVAKRRLFYSLLKLDLPLATRAEDPEHGLAFDFLADQPQVSGPKVLTGHDNGLITIAVVEADDAEREQRRAKMREPYRTLLGHFRHEVGHHFWDVLVRDSGLLDASRAVFGDDSQDYNAALQRHYANGAPPGWQDSFVSAYATAHPWEDFAETWAHYLHIVDTLEMGSAFGLRVAPAVARDDSLDVALDFNPYRANGWDTIIEAWLPLTFAVNSLNRSMGQPDLYPFVLGPNVIAKLGFIHDLVHRQVRQPAAADAAA
jgi:hypothetical protein